MNINSQIVSERFWSKVEVGKKLLCWPWKGSRDSLGYGQFRNNGKTIRAPRVAFWLRNGRWPKNACHKCDNASCCNPDHLFDGTHSDNMRDMMVKDRHRSVAGEKHGRAVLNNRKVVEIRRLYASGINNMMALADRFNCSFSTIQRIIAKTTWRHLP